VSGWLPATALITLLRTISRDCAVVEQNKGDADKLRDLSFSSRGCCVPGDCLGHHG
jgi:hypothetical protein